MKRTRAEAIKAKELFYNTRKPCKRGHLAPRSTITMACVECRKEWAKDQHERNREIRQQLTVKTSVA